MNYQSITCGYRYCGLKRLDLKRCSRCRVVYYCGEACQWIDWITRHKRKCRKPDKDKTKDKPDIDNDVKVNGPDKCSRQEETNGDTVTIRDGDLAGNHQGDPNDESVYSEQKPLGKCHVCRLDGCSLKCGRCRYVYYCSKQCQKKDWGQHKTQCQPKKPNTMHGVSSRFTADGQRVILEMKRRLVRFSMSIQECQRLGMDMHSPEMLIFLKKLIHGELQIHPRPLGSLSSAHAFARRAYPYQTWDIIDSFSEIPPNRPGLPFRIIPVFMLRPVNVFVAFIFMRHDHVTRHGVYIKDSSDKIDYVEFYLDNDKPSPLFNYSQIKPGNYILLENPVKHRFKDGQVGIRVDDPSTVKIYNPQFDIDVSSKNT